MPIWSVPTWITSALVPARSSAQRPLPGVLSLLFVATLLVSLLGCAGTPHGSQVGGAIARDSYPNLFAQAGYGPEDIRAKIDTAFTLAWREILQQFDLVTARCFHDCKLELCTLDSSDFTGHFASLMRGM